MVRGAVRWTLCAVLLDPVWHSFSSCCPFLFVCFPIPIFCVGACPLVCLVAPGLWKGVILWETGEGNRLCDERAEAVFEVVVVVVEAAGARACLAPANS